MKSTSIPGHRFDNIDALRDLAASLVVWLHGSEIFVGLPGIEGRGAWLHEVARAVDLGRVGVVAFYLISGYVIRHSLHGDTQGGIQRFGIRRFYRLSPAFWLSIPLAYASVWVLWKRSFDAGDVLANVTILSAAFSREAAMGLYWTLETELVFYGLVTVMFVLGVLRRPAVQLGSLFSLLALFALQQIDFAPRPQLSQWRLIPLSLALMFCGSLCRHAIDDARKARMPSGIGTLLIDLGVCSIALAALSYYAVELPAIKVARRLTAR